MNSQGVNVQEYRLKLIPSGEFEDSACHLVAPCERREHYRRLLDALADLRRRAAESDDARRFIWKVCEEFDHLDREKSRRFEELEKTDRYAVWERNLTAEWGAARGVERLYQQWLKLAPNHHGVMKRWVLDPQAALDMGPLTHERLLAEIDAYTAEGERDLVTLAAKHAADEVDVFD